MGIKEIELIDAGEKECSLNTSIEQLNEAIKSYNEIVDPIEENANKSLEACKLEKTGASAKHVFKGTIVSLAADSSMSLEDLNKEIEILEQEPWIKLGPKFNKWDGLNESLPAWVTAFFLVPEKIEPVMKSIEPLPEQISESGEKAPDEFAELEPMAKAKMVS